MVEASYDEARTKKIQEDHRILVPKHTIRLQEEAKNGEEVPS